MPARWGGREGGRDRSSWFGRQERRHDYPTERLKGRRRRRRRLKEAEKDWSDTRLIKLLVSNGVTRVYLL